MARFGCPRCTLALAWCPDDRLYCLSCARYFKVTLEEDRFGPYTDEEEHRNLIEFIEEIAAPTRGRR